MSFASIKDNIVIKNSIKLRFAFIKDKIVRQRCIDGAKRENILCRGVVRYTDKILEKQDDLYSVYDFKVKGFDDVYVELKTYNYDVKARNSWFVGENKIAYFEKLKKENPNIIVYLIFGFFPNQKKGVFKYLKVNNFEELKTDLFVFNDKKHYNIQDNLMNDIKGFFDSLNELRKL